MVQGGESKAAFACKNTLLDGCTCNGIIGSGVNIPETTACFNKSTKGSNAAWLQSPPMS